MLLTHACRSPMRARAPPSCASEHGGTRGAALARSRLCREMSVAIGTRVVSPQRFSKIYKIVL